MTALDARSSGPQTTPDLPRVEAALTRLYVGDQAGRRLRREDLKKARELVGLLAEVQRRRPARLVDAAAGHGCVGLLAAELLGTPEVVLLERLPERLQRAREAAARLHAPAAVTFREGNVGDPALWPSEPDLVVALHACGAAADAIVDRAAGARARWILLCPCCHGHDAYFAGRAEALAAGLGSGGGGHGELRRRLVQTLVDTERTLRLEAHGYEVTATTFAPPTVTPHNLLLRARRVGEPGRMAAARARLEALKNG